MSELPDGKPSLPVVLVVDDEDLVREVTRRVLESAGYQVVEASNGARALGILMQGGVDAVVTDIRMPGMDGWELAGRVTMMTPRPAILFMSGYEAHVGTSFSVPVLAKPFRPELLVDNVRQVLLARQT
jgi:two-component system cell cycle sensor histidine kinase/response regulator CckA